MCGFVPSQPEAFFEESLESQERRRREAEEAHERAAHAAAAREAEAAAAASACGGGDAAAGGDAPAAAAEPHAADVKKKRSDDGESEAEEEEESDSEDSDSDSEESDEGESADGAGESPKKVPPKPKRAALLATLTEPDHPEDSALPPVVVHGGAGFLIRGVDESGAPVDRTMKGLFEPLRAHPSFDVWSFGARHLPAQPVVRARMSCFDLRVLFLGAGESASIAACLLAGMRRLCVV